MVKISNINGKIPQKRWRVPTVCIGENPLGGLAQPMVGGRYIHVDFTPAQQRKLNSLSGEEYWAYKIKLFKKHFNKTG